MSLQWKVTGSLIISCGWNQLATLTSEEALSLVVISWSLQSGCKLAPFQVSDLPRVPSTACFMDVVNAVCLINTPVPLNSFQVPALLEDKESKLLPSSHLAGRSLPTFRGTRSTLAFVPEPHRKPALLFLPHFLQWPTDLPAFLLSCSCSPVSILPAKELLLTSTGPASFFS